MEEIFQLIFEIFGQAILEFIVDAVWRTMPPSGRVVLKIVFCAGIGTLFGVLSSIPFSEPFIASETGRIVYLLVVPLVLGVTMAQVGKYMTARGKKRSSLESFGFGWLFAFTFALARYLATK